MNNMLSSYDTVTMDSATFPRIANPAPADQHANDRGQDLSMKISEAETTGGGGGSGEDAGTGGGGSKGSGGTRIKPIDTRIRLQLMKTQVCRSHLSAGLLYVVLWAMAIDLC